MRVANEPSKEILLDYGLSRKRTNWKREHFYVYIISRTDDVFARSVRKPLQLPKVRCSTGCAVTRQL